MAHETLAKKLANEIKAHKATKQLLKEKNLDYKVLEEQNHATELDRDYWRNKFNELQKGALVYTVDSEGYIDNAVVIPNDFETSFVQDVPSEIGTVAYNRNRFYKIENGIVVKDTEKYKLYIGGIL